MYFPSDNPTLPAIALPDVIALGQGPVQPKQEFAPDPHPGMPPPGLAGQPGGYAHVDTGAMCWESAHPDHQAAWKAITDLGDPANTRAGFGAIDLRNTIMRCLSLQRQPVDELRGNDPDDRKRIAIADAVADFAASPTPDPSRLDAPGSRITLINVLAILDATYVTNLNAVLPPVLTLLVLRHLKAGSTYDAAVLARYRQVFSQQAGNHAEDDEDAHRNLETLRQDFLRQAANTQAAFRALQPNRPIADDQDFPEDVRQCLSMLADAYRLNLSVAQKTELIGTLEAYLQVRAEPADDTAAVLRRILAFHDCTRPDTAVAPPLPLVLSAILALGWFNFQDGKCLREGSNVPRTLTGHPALPDAIRNALCTTSRHRPSHGGRGPDWPTRPAPPP